jgi:hypothetical protein
MDSGVGDATFPLRPSVELIVVSAFSDEDLLWVETVGPHGDFIENLNYRFVPDGLML